MSPEVAETEAIARALERLELGDTTPARAVLVSRLDPPRGAYYLVVVGDPGAAHGVAAVDASSGEVTQWATLPGAAPHPLLDRETAIQRTGASSARRAELVWRSSPASRSPLYPLWEIDTGDEVVYVDHAGRVWPSLEAGAGGG
ncbi:MAG TPA: hypothetical protein VFP56_00315 [Candidatus Limnocylindrales bacterium]|nr:hypothetical protein [Candidatus Limnocylindrales bacterium]